MGAPRKAAAAKVVKKNPAAPTMKKPAGTDPPKTPEKDEVDDPDPSFGFDLTMPSTVFLKIP